MSKATCTFVKACALESSAFSSSLLQLAYWTSVAAMIVVALMLIAIAALRAALVLRERRERKVRARWRPILAQSIEALPHAVPHIARLDRYLVLYLWNSLHESLRGEAKEQINKLALASGVDVIVRKLLAGRSLRARLVALSTLGHLQDKTRWNEIVALAREDHPVISIVAARALLMIDKDAALPLLMPLIVTRSDWPVARVAGMLKEAGPDAVSEPVITALANANEHQVQRMVSYLRLVHIDQAALAIRGILAKYQTPNLLAACLKVMANPADLDVVRSHVAHSSWFVRVAVAHALGRIGRQEDVEALLKLLGDREWWVRYRAAQALISLPFLGKKELAAIAENLTDPFARDILQQAVMEGNGAKVSRGT